MPDLSHTSLDSALLACVAVACACWIGWCLLTLAVALFDRGLAARFGPPVLRGMLVAGTCAATVVPARAAESGAGALDGLRLPDRPVTPVAAAPPVHADRPPVHLVRPGDCLWSIVRERLPEADDTTVARHVARWFAANRDLIGVDPDLLQPGQELVPPQEHHDHRHRPRDHALRLTPGATAVPGEGPPAAGAGGTR